MTLRCHKEVSRKNQGAPEQGSRSILCRGDALHQLRFILLIAEFEQLCPPDTSEDEWQEDLWEVSDQLAESCRAVDPTSTDKALEQARSVDEPEA